MRNFHFALPFRIIPTCYALIGVLVLGYIITIAVVMSYAALTIEFTQSVRNDTSAVARLEKQYLTEVARITAIDYTREGYAKPETKLFVRAKSGTALR
jgi:hypothetical protein